jgi:phosphoglycerol transferase MdoB-like AlkP superfamily enzyme
VTNRRTLWEEGRRPGRQVVTLTVLALLAVVVLNLLLSAKLTWFYDLAFVLVCVAAALAVRPRDFFVVGVFPPLLMFGTVTTLALIDRPAVADPVDPLVQAVVSGLAHHAGALVAGYGLTLGILALRQVAIRNSGRIRTESSGPAPRRRPSSHALS